MDAKESGFKYEFRMYFYLYMLYAFLGWIYETLLFSVNERRFVNRGFNFGPWIPIYGFGAVVIMLAVVYFIGDRCTFRGRNIRPVAVFFLIGILATLAELAGSYIMQNVFGLKLWDYSELRLNFEGRIALRPSFIFAAGGTFLFYTVQPLGKKLLDRFSIPTQKKVASVLFVIVMLDFAASAVTTVWFPDLFKHPGILGRV
ncbi:MAG: putative ABC transporter permease [Fusobacteriaceae bacterium]|jgi:uncharacterized membrane protein|nr:putative ABC transporter permease [Fusobacteriaceae bacterium]